MKDNQMKDASKQEFEKHATEVLMLSIDEIALSGTDYREYESQSTRENWITWQAARQSISQSEPIAYNHYFKYSDGELEQVLSHQETVPVIQGLVYTGKTEKLGVIS
jgi:hypothetical protein